MAHSLQFISKRFEAEMHKGKFQDRIEAGRLLAKKLTKYADKNPVILALPRGGLPLGAEIAAALKAPLDILAVKKIGAPGHPEFAIGAISEDGILILNEELISAVDPARRYISNAAKMKAEELQKQVDAFRRVRPLISVKGRTVILVDDGLATGATMEAAVKVLRQRQVKEIIIAVPVASLEAFWNLKAKVKELVALIVPQEFYAVGLWYDDFSEVTDEEAIAFLGLSGRSAGSIVA
jgi:putative phosphoribosyl transferase